MRENVESWGVFIEPRTVNQENTNLSLGKSAFILIHSSNSTGVIQCSSHLCRFFFFFLFPFFFFFSYIFIPIEMLEQNLDFTYPYKKGQKTLIFSNLFFQNLQRKKFFLQFLSFSRTTNGVKG